MVPIDDGDKEKQCSDIDRECGAKEWNQYGKSHTELYRLRVDGMAWVLRRVPRHLRPYAFFAMVDADVMVLIPLHDWKKEFQACDELWVDALATFGPVRSWLYPRFQRHFEEGLVISPAAMQTIFEQAMKKSAHPETVWLCAPESLQKKLCAMWARVLPLLSTSAEYQNDRKALANDPDAIDTAIQICASSLLCIDTKWIEQKQDLRVAAIQKHPDALVCVSYNARTLRLCVEAVTKNVSMLQFVPEEHFCEEQLWRAVEDTECAEDACVPLVVDSRWQQRGRIAIERACARLCVDRTSFAMVLSATAMASATLSERVEVIRASLAVAPNWWPFFVSGWGCAERAVFSAAVSDASGLPLELCGVCVACAWA